MRSIIILGPLSSLPSFSSITHASINVTSTICDYRFGDLNAINHKKQKQKLDSHFLFLFAIITKLLSPLWYCLEFGETMGELDVDC